MATRLWTRPARRPRPGPALPVPAASRLSRPSPALSVTLINEGTYPYVPGGVSVWCDQLLRALPEHSFDLLTLTATGREALAWELPPSVRRLRSVPLWGPAPEAVPVRRALRARVLEHVEALVGAAARDDAEAAAGFEVALRGLVEPARSGALATVLRSDAGVSALCGAWQSADARLPLPGLPLAEALTATVLLEHTLRPLAVRLAGTDLNHAVANGLAALVGLLDAWERGTPLLVSEHGVYLRERYLAYQQTPMGPAVRAVLAGFHRQLAALVYREADLVIPVTDFNRRWERRVGATPHSVVTVPNGVDPARFPALDGEPDEPVLVWVGRIDPLKDLETLIEAFALVAAGRPGARLRLFGPVPAGNEEYADRCRALVAERGLGEAVTFEGPVPSSREAFAAGQVVVLSSLSEGLPYSVIEAMMCGRPTVSTDVGGVRECVGTTGLVVPPRDPAALAEACLGLLGDAARRARLSAQARERALGTFTLARFEDTFRELYRRAAPPRRVDAAHRRRPPGAPVRLVALPVQGTREARDALQEVPA